MIDQSGRKEEARKRSLFLLSDVLSIWIALETAWIVLCGCQINVDESPVFNHPAGSSYNDRAPCNAEWVMAHYQLAEEIRRLSWLCEHRPLLPAWLLNVTGYYAVPALVAGYLICRIWTVRKPVWRRTVLAITLAVMLPAVPFLKECIIVLFD